MKQYKITIFTPCLREFVDAENEAEAIQRGKDLFHTERVQNEYKIEVKEVIENDN